MKQQAIQWLWRVSGRKKWLIAGLIFVQAANGFLGVLYALLLRNIVDSAVDGDRLGFWHFSLLTAILVLFQVVLSAVNRFLQELSKSTFENCLKERLLHDILYKDFGAVSSVHSGEWMNRLTNDCKLVADNLTDILPGLSGMAVKLISAAVILVVLESRFAKILIPAGLVLLFFATAFRKRMKMLHKIIQEKDGNLRIFLQERIGSLMMIRSFVAEEQTEADAVDKMTAHKSARMKKNHFSNLCNIGFQTGMQGMYLIGVCYCGYGILTNTITYGTLTAITQLISQIQSPFANISGYLPKFYAMTASAERLMDIECFENDYDMPTKTMQDVQECYRTFSNICLRNISYTYLPTSKTVGLLSKETMPIVLHNISLNIRKGEYVAFTGHSGCGKSTVLKLLMCIYKHDCGERFLLDTSGKQTKLDGSWHRLFAYVPQGNQLMSGSIREIVAFSDRLGISDNKRITESLKIACADKFVNALEHGIDTILGERGTGLSEGQMQRIAIARAIFSDSPILLLDEATSALDERTEQKLLKNLRNMTDKTVIIITHRPAALDICDRVLQFTENGITERKS